ncbi:hypothetical protein CX680_31275, partial [Klebsiella pneumoniae]
STARVLALAPQKDWPVNAIASRVLPTLQADPAPSTFRGGDKRGGRSTARVLALAPQKDWPVNAIASRVLPTLQADPA